MPALKKKTPELYNETKSSVGSFAFMATTYVARYCKYHFINFTIKPCLSFTVVSYALKFSEFGMDGADRCVYAEACFNSARKKLLRILKMIPGEKKELLVSGLHWVCKCI